MLNETPHTMGVKSMARRRSIDLQIDENSNLTDGISLEYPVINIGNNKTVIPGGKWGGNFIL